MTDFVTPWLRVDDEEVLEELLLLNWPDAASKAAWWRLESLLQQSNELWFLTQNFSSLQRTYMVWQSRQQLQSQSSLIFCQGKRAVVG